MRIDTICTEFILTTIAPRLRMQVERAETKTLYRAILREMRGGFRVFRKMATWPSQQKMYDLGWAEKIKETTNVANVVGTVKSTISNVSDAATQETIVKAWAALDHCIKLREASQHPVDITVSVSLGPLQVTLSCPDVVDFEKD